MRTTVHTPAGPVVRLEGLSRIFPGPPPVAALRDARLSIMAGDLAVVVGRSGSGKSTLLNLLGMLDRPTRGTYLLNGVDTADLSERRRAAIRGAEIGFVHQSFQLLRERSALANVMMSDLYRGVRTDQSRRAAMDALSMVGMAHRAEQPPRLMSGGEKQRVAIARAICGNPSILLCDEPTGNLDTRNCEMIAEILQRLNGAGNTIILITHDRDVASIATRTFSMTDGHLEGVDLT